MYPLPFLSSQRFESCPITHTQILTESMCFPWYVVSNDISVAEDGESYQFKGFNGRCSFECIVFAPLQLGIFISVYSCTCTCTTILYCFPIFPSKLKYTNGHTSKSTFRITITTNISLCTLCQRIAIFNVLRLVSICVGHQFTQIVSCYDYLYSVSMFCQHRTNMRASCLPSRQSQQTTMLLFFLQVNACR